MKQPKEQELLRIMKGLQVTREQAIQIWKEDEGLEVNEEQEELVEKTKGMKLDLGAKSQEVIDKATSKEKKTRTKKPNETKRKIIQYLFEGLSTQGVTPQITNQEKYIEFDLEGNHYTINLVQKNKNKRIQYN